MKDEPLTDGMRINGPDAKVEEHAQAESAERPWKVQTTNPDENGYLALLERVLEHGDVRETRNGRTRSIFGANLEFDLSDAKLPLLTTKKMFFRGIIEELLFFLRGETDTKILEARGVNIWKANTSRAFLDAVGLNAYPEGEMGTMYGHQLRHFGGQTLNQNQSKNERRGGIDQLENVLQELCTDPMSRRILMTTLNPAQVGTGVLWPCHGIVIQFYVAAGRLSCKMYQRSADIFLGLPFNIASYAALVHIVCILCQHRGTVLFPGTLFISLGDVHLYEQHADAAKTQLARAPFAFPTLEIMALATKPEQLHYENFSLKLYRHQPAIVAEMVA